MKDRPDSGTQPTRRHFLRLGALAAAGAMAAPRLAANKLVSTPKSLAFYNTHTGEGLRVVYCADGRYLPEALAEINRILRDHRANQATSMDVHLLDLLYDLRLELGTQEPFHIISGYRSPATNEMLRKSGHGVAKHSLHREGKAADVRVPGRDLAQVRRAAVALLGGGVGYYPGSKFVHVDVGRVRYW